MRKDSYLRAGFCVYAFTTDTSKSTHCLVTLLWTDIGDPVCIVYPSSAPTIINIFLYEGGSNSSTLGVVRSEESSNTIG